MFLYFFLIILSISRPLSSFTLTPSITGCKKILRATDTENGEISTPSAADINARMEAELERMSEKDKNSIEIKEEDLEILFEDKDIVVVNKPSGVLSVPGKNNNPSLNKVVFDKVGCKMGRMDMMVVHRLSMDTSGVMVFAKTKGALKGMNKRFRERSISRLYEALVCGHVDDDEGFIELPLMRDFEKPPHMRVSTLNLQRKLMYFTKDDIDKKILEMPKESTTRYSVISREEFEGQPVTRVNLDSVTGRTNQLNVHLAAFGHPIVGDSIYGPGGNALSNGGLTDEELEELVYNSQRAPLSLQEQLTKNVSKLYVHAKVISFRHPVTNEEVSFSCDAPF